MAHFAKLSESGLVLSVHKVADEDCLDENNQESEAVGISFLSNLHGWPHWKKSSYNTRQGKYYNADFTEASDQSKAFRINHAIVGGKYDATLNGFIEAKPYDSWVLNNTTGCYDPPVTIPNVYDNIPGRDAEDCMIRSWNEEALRWEGFIQNSPSETFRWDAENLEWISL